MNVQQDKATFPFPVMFLLGSRTPDTGKKPQFGALIAKQAVSFNDANVQQSPRSSAILLTDELFASQRTKFEADVTVYKPRLDVVIVSASKFNFAHFGKVTITRGGVIGLPVTTRYDWQSRSKPPRVALAGTTDPNPTPGGPPILRFTPHVDFPFKLPEGFNSVFFSGRDPEANFGGVLAAGDTAHFVENVTDGFDLTVTVPAGPVLKFTRDCWGIAPPQWVSQGVDTVVMLIDERRALLTWRFVFVWETRLELVTLEVS